MDLQALFYLAMTSFGGLQSSFCLANTASEGLAGDLFECDHCLGRTNKKGLDALFKAVTVFKAARNHGDSKSQCLRRPEEPFCIKNVVALKTIVFYYRRSILVSVWLRCHLPSKGKTASSDPSPW